MPIPAELYKRLHRYRWLLGLAGAVLALDQVTKWLVFTSERLPFEVSYHAPYRITVIPSFFYLVHVGNTGAAWGLFAGKSFWLALLAVVTLLAIFIFRRHLGLEHPLVQFSFGLLCGGIAGNLIDRILHGHVIDFLDFHFGSFVWPAFNLADAAICVGVGLYILHTFREPESG